jgi:hypothetical protein
MPPEIDRRKNIQELENVNWGEPTHDSYLVTTVHALRRKPLNEYTVEDLRIMIGQQIGLTYLISLAVEKLAENPLASGDYYKGDLLKTVLSVDTGFWKQHEELWWAVQEIVVELEAIKETIDNELVPAAEKFKQATESF